MSNVTHRYKGGTMFFATVKPGADQFIYLSAYGDLASGLLEKYVDDQRVDSEELFAKWDESLKQVESEAGFVATHQVEDGYVYMSTFQNGIGASQED